MQCFTLAFSTLPLLLPELFFYSVKLVRLGACINYPRRAAAVTPLDKTLNAAPPLVTLSNVLCVAAVLSRHSSAEARAKCQTRRRSVIGTCLTRRRGQSKQSARHTDDDGPP